LPFEGRKVPASPSHALPHGELIVQNDQWVGKHKQAAASSSAEARSRC